MIKNHYHILGLGYNATPQEIKLAYRRLAKAYHPDVNAGDRNKEEMFKAVGQAYAILSDEQRKASYDLSLLLHLNEQSSSATSWNIRDRAYQPRTYYRRQPPMVYSRKVHMAMAAVLVSIVSAIFIIPLSLSRFSSEYHYDKGLEYYQNGQYYAALNSLDRSIIDFGSKNVEACMLAGTILMKEYKQYTYAIEYVDRGLKRTDSPGEKVQLLYIKGNCLKMSTDYYAAIKQFEEALTLWPQYDSLHYAIGETYAFRLDQYQAGIQYFNELVRINPNFAEGYYGKAYCYYKLRNYAEASQNIDHYFAKNQHHLFFQQPTENTASKVAATVGTAAVGTAAVGTATVEAATSLEAEAYVLKGKIALQLEQSETACDCWQKAAHMNGNNAQALANAHCP